MVICQFVDCFLFCLINPLVTYRKSHLEDKTHNCKQNILKASLLSYLPSTIHLGFSSVQVPFNEQWRSEDPVSQ